MENNKIIIYKTPESGIVIDVTVDDDTLWLSQQQIAELFEKDRTVIGRHIRNIYKEQELDEKSTCAFFTQVQKEGKRNVTRRLPYYNLDMIISVGYRVNSKRGTQFRIWANKILKEYLLKGYAVNSRITAARYNELKQMVDVMGRTVSQQKSLSKDEAVSLIGMVADYAYALDTLDKYDYQQLAVDSTTKEEPFHATYDNAMEMINCLRQRFGDGSLFGNEKDGSFKSSIGQIYQTFGGMDLYPSVEEKAAMLLYLVTKNHSFSDGNKRIAATLFLWFLDRNRILYNASGGKRIADNALVALTLMIAESRVEEKDMIVKVIVNLINQNNR